MALQSNKPSLPASKGGFLILPLHEVTALLASGFLIWVIYFGSGTFMAPKTVEEAAHHVTYVAAAALIYLGIQAYATLRQPIGADIGIMRDIVLSSLPLLVIIYALVDFARSHAEPEGLNPNYLTWTSIVLWGLATGIDTVIFSMFSLRILRRSPGAGGGGS